ncbi:MAG TPA: hypothetical protein VII58_11225 [Acidobacteriaceae bacterium]
MGGAIGGNAMLGAVTSSNSSGFLFTPRQLELAAKFHFQAVRLRAWAVANGLPPIFYGSTMRIPVCGCDGAWKSATPLDSGRRGFSFHCAGKAGSLRLLLSGAIPRQIPGSAERAVALNSVEL